MKIRHLRYSCLVPGEDKNGQRSCQDNPHHGKRQEVKLSTVKANHCDRLLVDDVTSLYFLPWRRLTTALAAVSSEHIPLDRIAITKGCLKSPSTSVSGVSTWSSHALGKYKPSLSLGLQKLLYLHFYFGQALSWGSTWLARFSPVSPSDRNCGTYGVSPPFSESQCGKCGGPTS